MATREVVQTVDDDGSETFTWTGLTTDDVGRAMKRPACNDKTVQAYGSFGTNALVTMQGSNDPRAITDPANAAWFPLKNNFEDAIAIVAATEGHVIVENPIYIRPSVTLGTNPNLTVTIVAVKKR